MFLFLLILIATPLWAQAPNLCDILDLVNCDGISRQGRRSSLHSLPSASSSALFNPATVSFDRGLGLEVIHQNNNPAVFNIASGTGKIGGALISTSMENTFFGNRIYELDEKYLHRRKEKKQYKTKKLSLALGAKLYKGKDVSVDLGIILKRHAEIKRVNPGIGLSAKLGPINIGASSYQDDFFLDLRNRIDPNDGVAYETSYGTEYYQERFAVTTFSAGTKFKNLGIDAGVIKTKYMRDLKDTTIHLYSASYQHKNFLFNTALRNEFSPAVKYIDGELKEEFFKSDVYAGIQASVGKHLILGLNYNYFLLDEVSFMATFFL